MDEPKPADDRPPDPYAIRIDWRDLGANAAGREARRQARSKRADAPIRSLAARALGIHTEERAWRIGADGEEKVGAVLDRLPDAWHVVHAVPVGSRGSDIDHLVIGPGGVVTINTKHHPDAEVWVAGDTFLVNGRRQPYVRNSRHEAARVAERLSRRTGIDLGVTGVIAVVGAHRGFTVKSQPDGVHVVGRRELRAWLLARPAVLPADRAAALFDAARRSDTWA